MSSHGRSNRNRRRQARQNGAKLPLEEYGMALSKQRLFAKGFDPRVSSLTPAQITDNWAQVVGSQLNKPSQEKWMNRMASSKDTGNVKSPDFFLVSPSLAVSHSSQPEPLLVSHLLRYEHIGANLVDLLYGEGFRTIQSLCTTSKAVLSCVQAYTSTWNLNSQVFENRGLSQVFVVFQPRLTVREVIEQGEAISTKEAPNSWPAAALGFEKRMLDTASKRIQEAREWLSSSQLRKTFSSREPLHLAGFSPHEPWATTQDCNQMLLDLEIIENIKQTSAKEHWERYSLPMALAASSLRSLLSQIHLGSKAITNLQLHEVPLVDRRMVAVILDECTSLNTLGINNCPLLHFGDTVSLLDLIHTLNTKGCSPERSEITAFNFYPRYYGHRPYNRPGMPALGLTCSPAPLETAQRGFFAIILKAYLKSRAMKIKLLFDEQNWLRTFLARVPNLPLSVVGFLDAIERSLKARSEPGDEDTKVQAMYDLLKPVRLGIEVIVEDWPKWYMGFTEERNYFCSSCGYAMALDFFPQHHRNILESRRHCCGCMLQRWLDQGLDSMRQEVMVLLGKFFPSWNQQAFNKDAPLPDFCGDILWLQSTDSSRPLGPIIVNDEGDIIFEHHPEALLRDNRMHENSMIGLPSLEDILEGEGADKTWKEAIDLFGKLDLYARVARCFHNEAKAHGWELGRRGLLRTLLTECDESILDECDMSVLKESTHRPLQATNYDFAMALAMARAVEVKGW